MKLLGHNKECSATAPGFHVHVKLGTLSYNQQKAKSTAEAACSAPARCWAGAFHDAQQLLLLDQGAAVLRSRGIPAQFPSAERLPVGDLSVGKWFKGITHKETETLVEEGNAQGEKASPPVLALYHSNPA